MIALLGRDNRGGVAMKKSGRFVLIVLCLVGISIFLSATMCSMRLGPTPKTYFVRVINDSEQMLYMYMNNGFVRNVEPESSNTTHGFTRQDRISFYNVTEGFWLRDDWGQTAWNIWIDFVFVYEGGGTWFVSQR